MHSLHLPYQIDECQNVGTLYEEHHKSPNEPRQTLEFPRMKGEVVLRSGAHVTVVEQSPKFDSKKTAPSQIFVVEGLWVYGLGYCSCSCLLTFMHWWIVIKMS